MTTTLKDLQQQTQANSTAPARKMGMQEIAQLDKKKQFPAMLDAFKSQIALALPSHLSADRMARLALTAFRQQPQLALCNPMSVFSAVVLSAQLGLEIGVDGQAYIVPYKGQATFIPGWKGYVELVNRAGKASVWTGAVFEGDKFEYALGDSPHVTHQPTGISDETKANLRYVYAIGRVHGAQWPVIEVWPAAKVLRHLNRYNKVGGKHYALANDNNFIAYGRKVALLQVLKYMPKSVELRAAEAIEAHGHAAVDLKDVIDGEWSHVAAEAAEAGEDAGDATEQQGQARDEREASTDSDAAVPAAAAPSATAAASDPSPTDKPRRSTRRVADPE